MNSSQSHRWLVKLTEGRLRPFLMTWMLFVNAVAYLDRRDASVAGQGTPLKSQLKDGVQEIAIAFPSNVTLCVIVCEYAGKTGPLTHRELKGRRLARVSARLS
jgi:hypothetical protein